MLSVVTYHFLAVGRVQLLLPNHLLDRRILHHLGLFLSPYHHIIFLTLNLEVISLIHLLELLHLVVLIHCLSPLFFFLLISH